MDSNLSRNFRGLRPMRLSLVAYLRPVRSGQRVARIAKVSYAGFGGTAKHALARHRRPECGSVSRGKTRRPAPDLASGDLGDLDGGPDHVGGAFFALWSFRHRACPCALQNTWYQGAHGFAYHSIVDAHVRTPGPLAQPQCPAIRHTRQTGQGCTLTPT